MDLLAAALACVDRGALEVGERIERRALDPVARLNLLARPEPARGVSARARAEPRHHHHRRISASPALSPWKTAFAL